MIFMRKKMAKSDVFLQLIFILNLLYGSQNIHEHQDIVNHGHDILMGSSLIHSRLRFNLNELHPKSINSLLSDELYCNYGNRQNFSPHLRDVLTYILDAEHPINFTSHNTRNLETSSSNRDSLLQFQDIYSNDDCGESANDLLFEELEFLDSVLKHEAISSAPDLEGANFIAFDDSTVKDSFLSFELNFPGNNEKDFEEEPRPSSSTTENAVDDVYSFLINASLHDEPEGSSTTQTEEVGGIRKGCEKTSNSSTNGPQATSEVVFDFELDDVTFDLEEALNLANDPLPQLSPPDSNSFTFRSQDFNSDSGCGESAHSESEGDSTPRAHTRGRETAPQSYGAEKVSNAPDDLDAINRQLDEMIQSSQSHSRNFQNRVGLVRGGGMEQRWQDLASLLSLSSPESPHVQSPPVATSVVTPMHPHHGHITQIHHPHAVYPSPQDATLGNASHLSRGILIHNATLPPPLSDQPNISYTTNSMGASSHLVSSSMNLTANSEEINPASHPYKIENASGATAAPETNLYYQPNSSELSQHHHHHHQDGFLSSILSDDDLQLMDIPMHENSYNGRAEYTGAYRYGTTDDHQRLAPVAQKKHQMYGKRAGYFHDAQQMAIHQANPGPSHMSISPSPLNISVNATPSPNYPYYSLPPPHLANSSHVPSQHEMKYSCTMEFSRPGDIIPIQHNHTYSSLEGPSGIQRPHVKDRRGRKSDGEKSLTRDEKRAMQHNVPMSCDDIINLPMDEFNERISKYDLTETQLSLIRDIRRRGKNKVAAQNCRKRKLDQIVHLSEEVKSIQYKKNDLYNQKDRLTAELNRAKHKYSLLYRHIFQYLRDDEGNPYSQHHFSLQLSMDGSFLLVPRHHSSSNPTHYHQHSTDASKSHLKPDGGAH